MENRARELASAADVAAWLGISTRTLRRLVEKGQIPQVVVGGTPIFRWRDVGAALGIDGRAGATSAPLMTRHEFAERLSVPPAEVRRLTEAGVFRQVAVGHSARWLAQDVAQMAGGRA